MPDGLEDLQDKLDLANKRAPGKIIERMDKLGNKVRTAARNETPVGPKKKKKGNRLKYNYKLTPTKKVGGVWTKGMWNKAPHFHLVKYGHKVVKGKKVVGIARGVDYVEKGVTKIEDSIDKEFEKMIDDLMGDIFD